jgi:23S rRNA U2552 (ribose-2'-O)-methylase RlmE/FtsJ
MKKHINIQLTEEDVIYAIKQYITKQHPNLIVSDMIFKTTVKGDYDKGTAIESVSSVTCECIEDNTIYGRTFG